ncbi:hypothetical protein ACMFMF_004652 [Clarireedia jacksonii]
MYRLSKPTINCFPSPCVCQSSDSAHGKYTLKQTGLQGDPVFDAYYASTVQFQSDTVIQEKNMRSAGATLLNRTGPAILLSHSQGGLLPWVIADAAPGKVVAIVSIEPTGPPFQDTVFPPTTPGGYTRPWGITDIPITYEPALGANETLQWERVANNRMKDELATCLLQKEPARRLLNLDGIPVLVETGEASFHAVYDGCTVAFLKQAGVDVEWMPLATKGIHGNGHLQFLEKNSDEIARVLDEWIRRKVGGYDLEAAPRSCAEDQSRLGNLSFSDFGLRHGTEAGVRSNSVVSVGNRESAPCCRRLISRMSN